MYFKVFIKDVLSPLKMSIVYKEVDFLRGRKPDLAVYSSMTNKEPSASDNYRASINPKKTVRVSAPKNQLRFENDYLYITMLSQSGASLEVTI